MKVQNDKENISHQITSLYCSFYFVVCYTCSFM